MLQSKQKLGSIVPGPRLVELSLPLQMVKQFSTIDKRQYQVQLLGTLEGKLEGHNEWAIDLSEDSSFSKSMRDF